MKSDQIKLIELTELVRTYYDEPHRKYHNMNHINSMLRSAQKIVEEEQLTIFPWELFLSILFHDIQYVPGSKTNEEMSVNVFKYFFIDQQITDETIKHLDLFHEVSELILLTREGTDCIKELRTLSSGRDRLWPMPTVAEKDSKCLGRLETAQYFLDLDLEILGRPWNEYDTAAKNIRREYCIFTEVDFWEGRREFLKGMLAKDHIFHSEMFSKKYEKQAQKNMKKELEKVEKLCSY